MKLDIPVPDNPQGNAPVEFIEANFKHPEENIIANVGDPVRLASFQSGMIKTLFGTLKADGTRRFQRLYEFIAGKNAKSFLSSLILCYYLLCVKQNQRLIGIAESRDQATIIFDMAAGILNQSGFVHENHVKVSDFHKRITNTRNGNVYKVKTSKPGTIDGWIGDVCFFDELHRVTKAAELMAIINKGVANRREPLILCTTTAGFDCSTYCYHKYKECKEILEGRKEAGSVLPYIYEVPIEDDIYDEANWVKANPALAEDEPFLSIEQLRIAAESAKHSPVEEMNFRRFHCNQFTDAEVSWIQMSVWDKCDGPVNEKALEGMTAYGGFDFAPVNDLSALVLAIPVNGVYHLICRAWLPRPGIKSRCQHDGIDYLEWERDGYLTLTDTDTTNLKAIKADTLALAKRYQVESIAADPFNTVSLNQELTESGVLMFENPNSHAMMNYPCQQFERAVLEQRILHGGNPLLRHCVANMVVHLDHGQRMKPDKKASRGKTDAGVAAVLAIGRAATVEEPEIDADEYFKQGVRWAG